MSFGIESKDNTAIQYETNTQSTASMGGSQGDQSPTIWSSGAVTFTDAGMTGRALEGMQAVIESSLSNSKTQLRDLLSLASSTLDSGKDTTNQSLNLLASLSAAQSDANARAAESGNTLLKSVLAGNQTLAENNQTGGASTSAKTTTTFMVVLGVFAMIAIFLFRK